MKFEGKTFYLYVSQKEVSASPASLPWHSLGTACSFPRGSLGTASPGHGHRAVPALGSPPCCCQPWAWTHSPPQPQAVPSLGIIPRSFLIRCHHPSQPEQLWLQLARTGGTSGNFSVILAGSRVGAVTPHLPIAHARGAPG